MFISQDNNIPQVIPIILCFIHCIAVFVTICFIMTCTLYTIVNIDQDEMKLVLVNNYYLAGKINQH